MKVETFNQQNRIVIHTNDGWVVLVSYRTPVAARAPDGNVYRTSRKWSVTTSQHVSQWLGGQTDVQYRGQEFFDTLLHAR